MLFTTYIKCKTCFDCDVILLLLLLFYLKLIKSLKLYVRVIIQVPESYLISVVHYKTFSSLKYSYPVFSRYLIHTRFTFYS